MSLSNNFPTISPSLSLDFARVGSLDPRITFTRASTGTYYDGVTTAKAEENLFVQSENFLTTWVNQNVVRTVNTVVAPDGTTTADTIESDSTNSSHAVYQTISFVSGQTYTLSMFLKKGTGDYAQLRFFSAVGGAFANFDLDTGVVGTTGKSSGNDPTATITAVGNGWYRCSITVAVNATASTGVGMYITTSSSAAGAEVHTSVLNVYAWGAQLEQRSAVTAYTATTTQPITNYIPVLQTAAANVARFDHTPTTGEALGLLIEEQRSNICLQSEDFATTWTTAATSVETNVAIAPNGTLTADRLIVDGTTAFHGLNQSIAVVTGTAYTFSVYAKANGNNFLRVGFSSARFGTTVAYFNLSTGALGTVTGGTATITNAGNGWYRCSFTATCTSTGTSSHSLIYSSQSDNQGTFTGDGWSGLFAWGAQLEAGAFPTSAIATTSAQVTRSADAASMTGTNFSSWYNQGEGTLYAEAQYISSGTPPANQITFVVKDSSATNYINARRSSSSGNTVSDIFYSGASQASLLYGSFANSVAFKLSVAYAVNNFAACGNSGSVAIDTSGNIPVSVSTMYIGCAGTNSQVINGHIHKVSYYPVRLSNANLQALTS